ELFYMDITQRLLTDCRRIVVLICIVQYNLQRELTNGCQIKNDPRGTKTRVLRAAIALGLVRRDSKGLYRWAKPYVRDIAAWSQTLHIVLHHSTYISLASRLTLSAPTSPIRQLQESPSDYLLFLQGVDVSHVAHAHWLTSLKGLSKAQTLIDLGGGLGTFSNSWIESANDRRAVVVDLPNVRTFLMNKSRRQPSGRVKFIGADLTNLKSIPSGDVYLLANVLHLLPKWQGVLSRVVKAMRPGSQLIVME